MQEKSRKKNKFENLLKSIGRLEIEDEEPFDWSRFSFLPKADSAKTSAAYSSDEDDSVESSASSSDGDGNYKIKESSEEDSTDTSVNMEQQIPGMPTRDDYQNRIEDWKENQRNHFLITGQRNRLLDIFDEIKANPNLSKKDKADLGTQLQKMKNACMPSDLEHPPTPTTSRNPAEKPAFMRAYRDRLLDHRHATLNWANMAQLMNVTDSWINDQPLIKGADQGPIRKDGGGGGGGGGPNVTPDDRL